LAYILYENNNKNNQVTIRYYNKAAVLVQKHMIS